MTAAAERPMYLEYDKPVGRPRRYCCYKDSPCPTHAAAFQALVGAALDAPGDCKEKLEALRNHAPASAMSAELGPLLDSEEDPARLWAEIHRLRAAVAGPQGYATWQEAATSERMRRMSKEQTIETLLRGITDARCLIDPIWRERMGVEQVRGHVQRGMRCITSAITDCQLTGPTVERSDASEWCEPGRSSLVPAKAEDQVATELPTAKARPLLKTPNPAMNAVSSMDCRVGPYPSGTQLFSMQHGERVLHKASFMKPGTKCLVRYRQVGSRPTWIPCEELQVVQPNTGVER